MDNPDIVFNKMYIDNTIKDIRSNISKNKSQAKTTLKNLSLHLNSLLPKLENTTLTEIDDLIYENENIVTTEQTYAFTEEEIQWLREKCFGIYEKPYTYFRENLYNPGSNSRILDTTYLQLAQHVHDDINIFGNIDQLLTSRNVQKMCLMLKLLNLTFENQKGFITSSLTQVSDECLPWLQNLQNMPPGVSPQKKKIISWIKYQCTMMTEKYLNDQNIKGESKKWHKLNEKFKKMIKKKKFNAKFIKKLNQSELSNQLFYYDYLYTFFMSARDEKEKVERLKEFLKGTCLVYIKDSEEYIDIVSLENIKEVVKNITNQLVVFMNYNNYSEEQLIDIEKYHDYEFEPYLNQEANNSKENLKVPKNHEKTDLIKLESDDDDKPDYTIEKFIFFDDFMKKLHLLNIINTAFKMWPKLFKTEKDNFEVIELFKNFDDSSERLKCIDELFSNTPNPRLMWFNKILFRKCPFLFLSSRHECFKEDLIKLLNGEKIDEMSFEELYFVINGVSLTDIKKKSFT